MTDTRKTISAWWIVINTEWFVVVTNQNNDSRSLPKWHVEAWEELLEAAIREIWEETGITSLDYVKKLWHYERYKIWLDGKDDTSEVKEIHMYLFTTTAQLLVPSDPQNPFATRVLPEHVSSILTHKKDKVFFQQILDQWFLNEYII